MKRYIRTRKNELLVFNDTLFSYLNARTKEIYRDNIIVDREGDYIQLVVKNDDLVKIKKQVKEAREVSRYEIEMYATEIFFKCLSGFTLVAIRNKKGNWETV